MHQPNGVRFATAHLSTAVSIHYAEQGDRMGEAIIFLHGYTDSWFAFSRVLSLLSPSYHAFALDQRGHGDSDKPQCCYTADDFTADIEGFMEAVGVEEASLIGDSLPRRAGQGGARAWGAQGARPGGQVRRGQLASRASRGNGGAGRASWSRHVDARVPGANPVASGARGVRFGEGGGPSSLPLRSGVRPARLGRSSLPNFGEGPQARFRGLPFHVAR